MPSSCNLFLSLSDGAMIEASRTDGLWAGTISPKVLELLQTTDSVVANRVAAILRSHDHPANAKVVEQLLTNVIENASVPRAYVNALPDAVARILEVTPDALGLVQAVSSWGRRATSSAQTLKHRTRGAGFAYELLGTAAIIQADSLAKNAAVCLGIYPDSDRIDFGVKLQASYPRAGSALSGQPDRETVEADLLIRRDNWLGNETRTIAVDFKHTQSNTYTGSISQPALAGIQSAIKTGEIDEFHFVTNGAFSEGHVNAIAAANEQLLDMEISATIYYHEYVQCPGV